MSLCYLVYLLKQQEGVRKAQKIGNSYLRAQTRLFCCAASARMTGPTEAAVSAFGGCCLQRLPTAFLQLKSTSHMSAPKSWHASYMVRAGVYSRRHHVCAAVPHAVSRQPSVQWLGAFSSPTYFISSSSTSPSRGRDAAEDARRRARRRRRSATSSSS